MGWLRKKLGQEKRASKSETIDHVVDRIIQVVSNKGPEEGLDTLETYINHDDRIIENRGTNADIEYKTGEIERKDYVQELFIRILDEELHEIEDLDSKLEGTEEKLDEAIVEGEIQGKHQANTFSDKLAKLVKGVDGDGRYSERRNGYKTLLNLSDFLIGLAEEENMSDMLPEKQVKELGQLCSERINMIESVNGHFNDYIRGSHDSQTAKKIDKELQEIYQDIEEEEHGFVEKFESKIES